MGFQMLSNEVRDVPPCQDSTRAEELRRLRGDAAPSALTSAVCATFFGLYFHRAELLYPTILYHPLLHVATPCKVDSLSREKEGLERMVAEAHALSEADTCQTPGPQLSPCHAAPVQQKFLLGLGTHLSDKSRSARLPGKRLAGCEVQG